MQVYKILWSVDDYNTKYSDDYRNCESGFVSGNIEQVEKEITRLNNEELPSEGGYYHYEEILVKHLNESS